MEIKSKERIVVAVVARVRWSDPDNRRAVPGDGEGFEEKKLAKKVFWPILPLVRCRDTEKLLCEPAFPSRRTDMHSFTTCWLAWKKPSTH